MADRDRPDRFPEHPETTHLYDREGTRRVLLMTPMLSAVGGVLAFAAVLFVVVVLPTSTYDPPPSDNWLPLTDEATAGRATYLANGCVYCHSGFSRPQDVFSGRYYLYPRESEPGDYEGPAQSPNILGSERTGPDLSQEGGMHPDDWHVAHYFNPRFTMPNSIMPRFSFFDDDELSDMIAFNQSQGGKEAALRWAAVTVGDRLMLVNQGLLSSNVAFPAYVAELQRDGTLPYRADGKPSDASPWGLPWKAVWMINSFSRGYWLTDNPLPLTQQNLLRGKATYVERCSGCHGQRGDGDGPAAVFLSPSPFPFAEGKKMKGPMSSDGMFYHRILTAGPGTAMENFGTRLSVEDIWRVVLFLRTIPNGGLDEAVPTVEMYEDWTPPPPLLRYIDDHPVDDQEAGLVQAPDPDPFMSAARWVAPGLAPEGSSDPDLPDHVLVGGQLPITLERLAGLIEDVYFDHVEEAYRDALERGEDLPPREEVFSTDGIEFHQPS